MWNLTRRTLVTMATLLGLLGISGAASAISIDLVWSGSGTNLTTANWLGPATLTLDVYATFAVPPGLSGLQVSVSYDPVALSVASCTVIYEGTPGQHVAGGYFRPALGKAATCDTSVAGIVGQMDQQSVFGIERYLPYLPGPGSVHIAEVQFHVAGSVFGNTVVQSFFDSIFDGWGDNNFAFSLNGAFGSATARLVPEPTTAALVGIGFLGLIAAARRQRRG